MNESAEKSELRKLDRELIELLARRFRLAEQSAQAGLKPGEAELIFREIKEEAESAGVPENIVRTLFREIHSAAALRSEKWRIAFLGPAATFTHQAAMEYFGSAVEYAAQPTIGDVFDTVCRKKCQYAVVPVENSTEGAVTHTLDMFVDAEVKIVAEINMAIHHCLLGRVSRKKLEVVYSHPQVIGQCRTWLQKNLPGVRLVEVSSTTDAAERCRREPKAGALAGKMAASEYKLPVIEENIEDCVGNTTRFFVLGRHFTEPTGQDKTSLFLAVRDRVGALYDVLLPFGRHGVNLSFIESRPSKRRNWEYYFFIDLNGHFKDETVAETMADIREHCENVKILGSYPLGAVYDKNKIT